MLKLVITYIQCIRFGIKYKKGLFIHPMCVISKYSSYISLEDGVSLHNLVRLDCHRGGKIVLRKGVGLNVGTRIECLHSVIIGKNVLTAPYVYISDVNHNYEDITKPINMQGYYGLGG